MAPVFTDKLTFTKSTCGIFRSKELDASSFTSSTRAIEACTVGATGINVGDPCCKNDALFLYGDTGGTEAKQKALAKAVSCPDAKADPKPTAATCAWPEPIAIADTVRGLPDQGSVIYSCKAADMWVVGKAVPADSAPKFDLVRGGGLILLIVLILAGAVVGIMMAMGGGDEEGDEEAAQDEEAKGEEAKTEEKKEGEES